MTTPDEVTRYLEAYVPAPKPGEEPPVFIPTGLYIESVEFKGPYDLVLSGYIWQRYADDLASAGFVTDMAELVQPPVDLWLHGHTHTSFDYVADGGTRVVCNPRGYIHRRTGERENTAFTWDKVVELG